MKSNPFSRERDFLRGEGDRLHALFLEERGKADEAHQGVVELLSKVNEIGVRYGLSTRREKDGW